MAPSGADHGWRHGVSNLHFCSSLARVSAAVLVADGLQDGAIEDARGRVRARGSRRLLQRSPVKTHFVGLRSQARARIVSPHLALVDYRPTLPLTQRACVDVPEMLGPRVSLTLDSASSESP
jgi:hypothetical protein